jgi:hypothetical protein
VACGSGAILRLQLCMSLAVCVAHGMSVFCSCSCVLAMAGRLPSGPGVCADVLAMCYAARIGRKQGRRESDRAVSCRLVRTRVLFRACSV